MTALDWIACIFLLIIIIIIIEKKLKTLALKMNLLCRHISTCFGPERAKKKKTLAQLYANINSIAI